MADLPRGAVTFLFTDVEGSTRLLKELRERYGEVLAEHQRLLEAAFDRHGGRVVDTQGDSFFVVFGNARDAVLAAIEAQRALSEHDWPEGADLRVRMGIHSGQAAASEEKYLGLAVHRAARISASGHGGQILVSQTTQNLLEDEEETSGIELRDLGEQRLKDLDRPVHVYQVAAEGLEREFPPLRNDAPSPAAEPEHRYPRRRTILAGALAGVIAAAVAIAIFAFGGGSGGGGLGEATGKDAIGSIDANTGDVEGGVELPGSPTAVAVGLGWVWAVSGDKNQVYAIDPETNEVRDRIDVGNAPAGIAVGGGFAWVTNSLDGTVMQISPQGQVLEDIEVGNGPTGIAFDKERGYVWVANTTDQTISKIRASTGKLVKNYAGGTDPGAVAVGEGAVWITGKSSDTVVKLNPRNGDLLDTIPVGQGPAAVAVGLGSVWVANNGDGTVSRINPATHSGPAIELGAGPSGITIAGGKVWTTNELAGTISRIDPATNRPTPLSLESRPTAVAAEGGIVYVALRPSGLAHRGGTLTVAVAETPGTLDLAVGYPFVGLTNDGLLTYRHVGGQAGAELVPDLALRKPDVSADGQTYTFQLRPNIRYANGGLVRASDFRRAIERVFRLPTRVDAEGKALFRGVRGADRCSRRRCDLAAGIDADDVTGTVKFHLSAPDTSFLYKLASPWPGGPVPAGTPLQEAKRRPLPATGPYRVENFTRRSVRLVRNSRFHEWSKDAQPEGFPDEIVFKAVRTQMERIALVEHAKADLTSSAPNRPFFVASAFRSEVRSHAYPATIYLSLNPNRPPFNDVRARQAVNYALDRNKVVQFAGGEDAGRPTCQVLPPNLPGYRRYCPYTIDSSAEGRWTGPDFAKAARLVIASGTAEAPVTVWYARNAGVGFGHYLKTLLKSLGYKPRLRSFSDEPAYHVMMRKMTASIPRTSLPQMAWGGWVPSYPSASDFISPLFSCGAENNYTGFCDPPFEQKIKRTALEQTDLAAANRGWAKLDHELTDKAVWVPLYTVYGVDLVSKRVGHYQYNPQLGPLLSQMWVR